MDSKMKYDLDNSIPDFSLTKIEQGIMDIWKSIEEGSELYKKCKDLTELIQKKTDEIGEIRSLIFLIANKL